MSSESSSELHVVMFPWFAFGHISPFVQLSNKLALHGVRISFLSAPGNIARIKSSLLSTPTTQIISLPIPAVEGLPPGLNSTAETTPAVAGLLKKALDLMQPQIKTILEDLKPHFVFFDHSQHWLPKLASQIGIKTISYTVFSATSTSYLTVPARISEEGESPSIGDLMKPPNGYPSTSITSVKAFQARDFSIVYKSFDGGPTIYDRAVGSRLGCTAMLLKTCQEMEGPYVDFIKKQFKKPVLLTGPLVPDPPSGVLDEKWANWLGQFPAKSVIFCSFGSETFLNHDQIQELVLGLELTGLPFFLVLNFPAELDSQTELNQALPSGFLERVKGRGVLHTGWVQQQLILAHSSVGCYVCHSGFSSLIEALVNDCQLAMLPLKGDQFLNTKLIAGDLRAGVEINRRDEDGYFGKDDICEAVKAVMLDVDKEPGKSTRENHKKWREFLLNAQIQNKYIAELIEELKAMA
ncbi:hypothetical protein POTOM_025803 [Populus tomentosa]|uniref:Glycosyltransferase n=1 Tax=Populus tomentosa TaxID=118781 RepID=A0A8X7ZPS3_POPTO|nr:hypothetical protein POTOM_025803 [Populus tomentosa]